MATTIVTKSGSGAPTASDLVAGELAVDLTNKRLYTEDSGGTVLELGTNPTTLVVDTDTLVVDATNNRVGIGTSSPSAPLTIGYSGAEAQLQINNSGDSRMVYLGAYSSNEGILRLFNSSNVETVRIPAESTAGVHTYFNAGNVGIGTSSPTSRLHLDGAEDRTGGLTLSAGGQNHTYFLSSDFVNVHNIETSSGSAAHTWQTNGSERLRIDASGNLLVGKTATSFSLAGIGLMANDQILATAASDNPLALNRLTTDGDIARFYKDSVQVGSIGVDNNDNFYIGASAGGHSGVYFGNTNVAPMAAGARADDTIDLGSVSHRWQDLYLSGTAYADDLLVGTTDTAVSSSTGSVTGTVINSTGLFEAAKTGTVMELNRLSANGTILNFRKNGTTVGSIGVGAASDYLAVGNNNTSIQFYASGIAPASGSVSTLSDNTKDIGSASVRWNDAYITNGVTTGSDANDKQDIETLSDAEQRVAVACKGLLRKWRWKDAVEDKGDEARIHFGIIAQDLQAAFETEGLDAGRYAMFMSNTWTDEETGEERSRMGVRYSELLAFIIAAI